MVFSFPVIKKIIKEYKKKIIKKTQTDVTEKLAWILQIMLVLGTIPYWHELMSLKLTVYLKRVFYYEKQQELQDKEAYGPVEWVKNFEIYDKTGQPLLKKGQARLLQRREALLLHNGAMVVTKRCRCYKMGTNYNKRVLQSGVIITKHATTIVSTESYWILNKIHLTSVLDLRFENLSSFTKKMNRKTEIGF